MELVFFYTQYRRLPKICLGSMVPRVEKGYMHNRELQSEGKQKMLIRRKLLRWRYFLCQNHSLLSLCLSFVFGSCSTIKSVAI